MKVITQTVVIISQERMLETPSIQRMELSTADDVFQMFNGMSGGAKELTDDELLSKFNDYIEIFAGDNIVMTEEDFNMIYQIEKKQHKELLEMELLELQG
jgi:hypothetical protein